MVLKAIARPGAPRVGRFPAAAGGPGLRPATGPPAPAPVQWPHHPAHRHPRQQPAWLRQQHTPTDSSRRQRQQLGPWPASSVSKRAQRPSRNCTSVRQTATPARPPMPAAPSAARLAFHASTAAKWTRCSAVRGPGHAARAALRAAHGGAAPCQAPRAVVVKTRAGHFHPRARDHRYQSALHADALKTSHPARWQQRRHRPMAGASCSESSTGRGAANTASTLAHARASARPSSSVTTSAMRCAGWLAKTTR